MAKMTFDEFYASQYGERWPSLREAMLSEEDVEKQVSSLLSNESNLNKGIAMKIVMPVLRGEADGKIIANAVERFLSKTS